MLIKRRNWINDPLLVCGLAPIPIPPLMLMPLSICYPGVHHLKRRCQLLLGMAYGYKKEEICYLIYAHALLKNSRPHWTASDLRFLEVGVFFGHCRFA